METSIKVDTLNKVTALRPSGNLTFRADTDRLLRRLIDEAAEGGGRMFILDMRHVKYMDSNSLGQLVGALHHVRELGGDIKLFGLQQRVLDAMVLVRLTELFEIYDEEGQAVAAYL